MTKPNVLMIVTQDTKQEEAAYMRAILEGAGCDVIHLDPSVRRTMGGAEISPDDVAAAADHTIESVRALGHEGKCQAVMTQGAVQCALKAHATQGLSGVVALGGSMGTGLAGTVMQALPYGLPKLIVSTMASGFTQPYLGVKDIAIMNAVTDISGINSISSEVFRNAALAVAGMAHGYAPHTAAAKPLVLMTTLGTTEKSVRRIREALEGDGCEVMVFHSSGAGGATLDGIAADRDVALVLDLSLTEILDHIHNGLANAGPDRSKAALARQIPAIFAPGNADFIIAGPIDAAQAQFPGKKYHIHNPALTAVRTDLEDLKPLADHLAGLFREAQGPVSFFVPLHGFSNHDSPYGHIHDPSIPPPFADYAQSVLPDNVEFRAIEAHFNDDDFADAIITKAREMLAK